MRFGEKMAGEERSINHFQLPVDTVNKHAHGYTQ